jgi:hypothetical protein
MSIATHFTVSDDFWSEFSLDKPDIEFIYNFLLDKEIPQSPREILSALIEDRLAREAENAEQAKSGSGDVYLPKESYKKGESLVFPALDYAKGTVQAVRAAKGALTTPHKVIQVEMENGDTHEFAAELAGHALNEPPDVDVDDPLLNPASVLDTFGESLQNTLIDTLRGQKEFVYIAGRWFPQALLVEINPGNLNLAEAVLDMHAGGPLPTEELKQQLDLPEGDNPKLVDFSLDLALQEDERFDEVGSTGQVAWFLKRLEPADVLETPVYLRYHAQEYDRAVLDEQMLRLEKRIDDEHSAVEHAPTDMADEMVVPLIFPHWRAGTLPLSPRLQKFFPSALESPRVQFNWIDGASGGAMTGWVVRLEKYVSGLRDWYLENGLMPGSRVTLRRGEKPGEVIVSAGSHRSTKEWVRTALIGADGGVVYALLKQQVEASFEERMMTYMPEETAGLDQAWERGVNRKRPFEQVVADTLRELAKLNPQTHVHAEELYSAVNVVVRTPPGPLFALLASRPWFEHVGDLHFRFDDSQQ